jgi:hypothetical protein
MAGDTLVIAYRFNDSLDDSPFHAVCNKLESSLCNLSYTQTGIQFV